MFGATTNTRAHQPPHPPINLNCVILVILLPLAIGMAVFTYLTNQDPWCCLICILLIISLMVSILLFPSHGRAGAGAGGAGGGMGAAGAHGWGQQGNAGVKTIELEPAELLESYHDPTARGTVGGIGGTAVGAGTRGSIAGTTLPGSAGDAGNYTIRKVTTVEEVEVKKQDGGTAGGTMRHGTTGPGGLHDGTGLHGLTMRDPTELPESLHGPGSSIHDSSLHGTISDGELLPVHGLDTGLGGSFSRTGGGADGSLHGGSFGHGGDGFGSHGGTGGHGASEGLVELPIDFEGGMHGSHLSDGRGLHGDGGSLQGDKHSLHGGSVGGDSFELPVAVGSLPGQSSLGHAGAQGTGKIIQSHTRHVREEDMVVHQLPIEMDAASTISAKSLPMDIVEGTGGTGRGGTQELSLHQGPDPSAVSLRGSGGLTGQGGKDVTSLSGGRGGVDGSQLGTLGGAGTRPGGLSEKEASELQSLQGGGLGGGLSQQAGLSTLGSLSQHHGRDGGSFSGYGGPGQLRSDEDLYRVYHDNAMGAQATEIPVVPYYDGGYSQGQAYGQGDATHAHAVATVHPGTGTGAGEAVVPFSPKNLDSSDWQLMATAQGEPMTVGSRLVYLNIAKNATIPPQYMNAYGHSIFNQYGNITTADLPPDIASDPQVAGALPPSMHHPHHGDAFSEKNMWWWLVTVIVIFLIIYLGGDIFGINPHSTGGGLASRNTRIGFTIGIMFCSLLLVGLYFYQHWRHRTILGRQ